eukprot:362944-Chlamydomonas_euryale.AAC.1
MHKQGALRSLAALARASLTSKPGACESVRAGVRVHEGMLRSLAALAQASLTGKLASLATCPPACRAALLPDDMPTCLSTCPAA